MAPSILSRGAAALQDLRALGVGAPLRAGLEVSKRLGAHGLLFGRLASQAEQSAASTQPAPRFEAPFPAVDPTVIDERVRARTLHEAQTIVAGSIELFGQRVDLGPDPDWHSALDGPGRWPQIPWWDIDIRSSARLGDVKWVWELGRHHHLVVLARAAALSPHEPVWLDTLDTQLSSWLAANPPEMGIHWYSNLEIALRAIAWCEIISLAGAALPASTRHGMLLALHHSGRHLLADLAYTVSTMRNNHLLGDALGLLVLGHAFADDDKARRWNQVGERVFAQQLKRQVHSDGSQIEDSVSYHRFVLEMLVSRLRLGAAAPDVRRATRTSAEMLVRLGVLDGPVPRYGDGDEGRVFTSTGPFDDLAGSTLVALAHCGLTHGGLTQLGVNHGGSDARAYDEVAWYAPASATPPPATLAGATPAPEPVTAERDGHGIGGGLARAERGDATVWLKAGGDISHGHADLCSTSIVVHQPSSLATHEPDRPSHGPSDGPTGDPTGDPTRGRTGGISVWLVGDPGTGTYNGPAEQRDYFRSSISHSVLRLAGLDQLEPHRAFRWRYEPEGAIGAPVADEDLVIMWGWHGAYRRLDPSRRVVRAVAIDAASVTVIDWVEGPTGIDYALSLPMHPDNTTGSLTEPNGDGFDGGGGGGGARGVEVDHIITPGGETYRLALPSSPARLTARRGVQSPFDGWWSTAYGAHQPAERLEVTGTIDGPVVWRVATVADTPLAGVAARDGNRVTIPVASATVRIHVEFFDDRVVLVAEGPATTSDTGAPVRRQRELLTPT